MNLTERIKELEKFNIKFHVEKSNLEEYPLQGDIVARYDDGIEIIEDEEFSSKIHVEDSEYIILKSELGRDRIKEMFGEKSGNYFDIMLEGHKILDIRLNLIYYFTLPSRSYLENI